MLLTLTAVAVASPSASAAYPGSHNGRLAYGMSVGGNVDVYSALPDGSGVRQLTTDPGFDACPAYSPDGKDITFCSGRGGAYEIWQMKQNGQQQRQVTHLGFALWPDYSPDGSRIAFEGRPASDPNIDVYLVKPDGSGLRALTSGAGNNLYPAWSPNGSKIAFISDRTGFEQVWVMNADGTGQTQLTFNAADHDQLPDWSPDGTKIAYEDDAAGNGDIYVMNADGTNQHDVSNDPSVEFGPSWSPDGSSIAFLSDRTGTRLVWVMGADGSAQHQLTGGLDTQYVPAWQPRGGQCGCSSAVVTSVPPLAASDTPFGITEGPGGTWYAEGNQIVRVRPSGTQDAFPLPDPASADAGWLAWSGGSQVWFTDRGTGRIGTVDQHGTVVEYQVPPGPDSTASPNGLVIEGSTVWFTDSPTDRLGRLDVRTGHTTMYAVPTSDAWPLGITMGPDHALWFVERSAGKLGRMTVHGAFQEWALAPDSFPNRITVGSDGAVWFTELRAGLIGRMTMQRHLTETPIDGGPVGITRAPDGHLYVALFNTTQLARLDWTGQVSQLWDVPGALLVAPSHGALWLTDPFSNTVTKVLVHCRW